MDNAVAMVQACLRVNGYFTITDSPEIAALAMSGSSALVAINALMLKRARLDGIRDGGAPARLRQRAD